MAAFNSASVDTVVSPATSVARSTAAQRTSEQQRIVHDQQRERKGVPKANLLIGVPSLTAIYYLGWLSRYLGDQIPHPTEEGGAHTLGSIYPAPARLAPVSREWHGSTIVLL